MSPTSAPTITPSVPPPLATPSPDPNVTPLPTRGPIEPGQKLPYVTQTGDYVTALAKHFYTTPEEILAANPGLPLTATLSSGRELQIPTYYFPFGGPVFKIVPDSEFVYGPASEGFDLDAYLREQPGYLKRLSAFVAQKQRSAAETILYVARQYSINPKLFLALMEWRTQALTSPNAPADAQTNPFGPLPRVSRADVEGSDWYLQMIWVAEQLTTGYYGWREGDLTTITLRGDFRSRVDMYQNAGTVGVHYLLAQFLSKDEFDVAVGEGGFAQTYAALWGDPWAAAGDVLPGDLTQPDLQLPFEPKQKWAFTGGPHPAWGTEGLAWPWAALDFAPAGISGCAASADWVTASADGYVVRSDDNTVIINLQGEASEQAGWVMFYFHVADRDRVAAGAKVKAGDPLGHPSCEGGRSTGTHVHMARKYNGEWLPADGIVPFVLGGWRAQSKDAAYQGRLVRLGAWVEASTASMEANRVYWAP